MSQFREKDLLRILNKADQEDALSAMLASNSFKKFVADRILGVNEVLVDFFDDVLTFLSPNKIRLLAKTFIKFGSMIAGETEEFDASPIKEVFEDVSTSETVQYWKKLYEDTAQELGETEELLLETKAILEDEEKKTARLRKKLNKMDIAFVATVSFCFNQWQLYKAQYLKSGDYGIGGRAYGFRESYNMASDQYNKL